jgi:hypothetical protein
MPLQPRALYSRTLNDEALLALRNILSQYTGGGMRRLNLCDRDVAYWQPRCMGQLAAWEESI